LKILEEQFAAAARQRGAPMGCCHHKEPVKITRIERYPVTKEKSALPPAGTAKKIFEAARDNNIAVLTKLCKEWAGHRCIDEFKSTSEFTSWMIAADFGHIEVLKVLIAAGANIQATHNGSNALHLAAREGHKAVCQLLADEGVDLKLKDYESKTPRKQAKKWGKLECEELLDVCEKRVVVYV